LDIEGTMFSTADKAHVQDLKEGDYVQVQWKKVGGYNNITGIRRIEHPVDAKNRQIVRMSCLNSASQVISSTKLPSTKKIERTLEAAKAFEAYVTPRE